MILLLIIQLYRSVLISQLVALTTSSDLNKADE